uniref:Uncharacterized protein n=1 Tax=Anopheles dirus TaxID=7168 RepID=A0A182NDP7_9DIPT
MWWDSRSDTFCFKTPASLHSFLEGNAVPTKRQLLSLLMSIYDPLGLIAGFLFFLKVILQEVWRAGVDWDQEIHLVQYEKWRSWIKCLAELEKISIPRCYRQRVDLNENNLQLHIFVDAGADGFAAVAYFRYEQDGIIEVALVGGKTRVAPIKYTSVPRLELQAAVLGTRLAHAIKTAHRQQIHSTRFWTDSKDVICWLRSDHRRYSTIVAHWVGEILEETDIHERQWIPTQLNVADEATKWSKLNAHLTASQWFQGPKFLASPEDSWSFKPCPHSSSEEEQKKPSIYTQRLNLIDSQIGSGCYDRSGTFAASCTTFDILMIAIQAHYPLG